MKHIGKFIAVCVLALGLFSSRAMAQTTVTGASVTKFEATSVDTQPKMFVTPLAADISIIQSSSTTFKTKGTITIPEAPDTKDPKVLDRYKADVRLGIMDAIEELKAQALFEFSESEGADLIVAPSYSVVTDRSEGRVIYVTVKVKGYPARYNNFRNLTTADTTLVLMNRTLAIGKQVKQIRAKGGEDEETREEVK